MGGRMNCEKHPEVAGTLAVDLPSIGVRRYLCEPCKAELTTALSQYKGKREAWDHAGYDYAVRGESAVYRDFRGAHYLNYNENNEEWR